MKDEYLKLVEANLDWKIRELQGPSTPRAKVDGKNVIMLCSNNYLNLTNHPKIKDLVIVGIPDELKGEAPKAFVVLKEGESLTLEELRGYCKPLMAPYKVPVALEFLDEVPRLASGKALRRQLRDREWE